VSDERSDALSEPRNESSKIGDFRDDENRRFSNHRAGVNRVRSGQMPTHSCWLDIQREL